MTFGEFLTQVESDTVVIGSNGLYYKVNGWNHVSESSSPIGPGMVWKQLLSIPVKLLFEITFEKVDEFFFYRSREYMLEKALTELFYAFFDLDLDSGELEFLPDAAKSLTPNDINFLRTLCTRYGS